MTESVGVVVPVREDGGRRDHLRRFVLPWWADHLGWPIFEGHHGHDGGPFNIAAARNLAAREAIDELDVEVLLLLDADVIPSDPDQARRAVATAHRTGRMTLGHDRWRSISERGSDRIMDGWLGDWGRYTDRVIERSWSNIVAVPRALWDELGGQDERFVGWGFEDMAFKTAALTIGRGLERIPGDVNHLWHPRSPEKEKGQPDYQANRALRNRYYAVAHDPEAMAELLAERTAA